jgi:hypothetical protein
MNKMALFYTEFLDLVCKDIQAEKKWWIATFDCKEVAMPNWDDPLPSDVALKLPGADEPTIQLRDKTEAQYYDHSDHPLIFCSNVKKAREHCLSRNLAPGPIQDGAGTQFFEIRDPEGHVIEICKEP